MEVIVLENGFVRDIPEDLIKYLEDNNISWVHYDTRFGFWPENRTNTIEYFKSLPKNQIFMCETVFDGFQQLELFIELLHSLKDKEFTLKIMNPSLCDNLIEFYNEYDSSISPKELDDFPKKRKEFKLEMNKKFLEVLQYHNIYWLYRFKKEDGILLKTLEEIDNLTWEKNR